MTAAIRGHPYWRVVCRRKAASLMAEHAALYGSAGFALDDARRNAVRWTQSRRRLHDQAMAERDPARLYGLASEYRFATMMVNEARVMLGMRQIRRVPAWVTQGFKNAKEVYGVWL